jgi:hypothetical protein
VNLSARLFLAKPQALLCHVAKLVAEYLLFTSWSTRSVCLFDFRLFCTGQPATVVFQHAALSNCVYGTSLDGFRFLLRRILR